MSQSPPTLPELSSEQARRYSRHILLPSMDWLGQERLLASHAVVVGLGGLGCSVAQFLAVSGVGKLTLIDDDIVELSNLQRQVLHSEANIGVNKAVSAKQQLLTLNSSLVIKVITHRPAKAQLNELAQNAEVLVDCTDNLTSRNTLNEVSVSSKTALIAGAAIRMEGQVSCFFPNESHLKFDSSPSPRSSSTHAPTLTPTVSESTPPQPCYACLSYLFGEQGETCMESGVLAPVVGIIGTMQALETVKYLSGVAPPPKGKVMLFDAAISEWRTMAIPVNPQCPVCQSRIANDK